MRINDSDRQLFITIHVYGEPYLMLLDEVLNHNYEKSRFLKPGAPGLAEPNSRITLR